MIATVLTRQLIPRLIVRENTERKLLFLLPVIRPIFRLVTFFVEPVASRRRSKSHPKLESTIAPDTVEEKSEDNAEDYAQWFERPFENNTERATRTLILLVTHRQLQSSLGCCDSGDSVC